MASLNWLDYLFLLIIAAGAFRGLSRGLLRSAAGVLGLGLGVLVALRYYRLLGDWLDVRLGWGPPLASFLERHLGSFGAVPLEVAGGFLAASPGEGATPLLVAGGILDLLAFLALVAVVSFGVRLATGLLVTAGGPVLAPADRLAGLAFGALRGVLLVLVLLLVLRFAALAHFLWGPNFVGTALEDSLLAPAFGALLDLALAIVAGRHG
ncbi:MAG: CvpA family protein [Bacillota bacterium]